MSRSSPDVVIVPDVFQWLCGSSGFAPSEISKRIGVPERVVRSWCNGAQKPVIPLTKVEQLSEMFRRPLAAFLLSEPPEEPNLPKDFRRHPDSGTLTFQSCYFFGILFQSSDPQGNT